MLFFLFSHLERNRHHTSLLCATQVFLREMVNDYQDRLLNV